MDKQFSSPPIEDDLRISLLQYIIPIHKTPVRLERCIVFICIEGTANLDVNSVKHTVIKNNMLILFPNQVVSLYSRSDNYAFAYFSISKRLFDDIIFRFPPNFVGYLKENFHHMLTNEGFHSIYNDYFRFVDKKFNDTDNICRREIITNTIRNFFLDTYNKIFNKLLSNKPERKRKHELVESFVNLLIAHHSQSREVAFYAEKLHITPKYLSMVLKEQTGRTSKQWIDNHVINEIKLLLKSTNMSIQEIAYQTNFSNQSFMCKYFKGHTGVSPTRYRTM